MKLIRKFTKSGQTDLVYFTTQVRHERYTKDTSATRVKNFDFDNDTSENIFSHPYKERNNFILRTPFWKCHVPMQKCGWKVHHKN